MDAILDLLLTTLIRRFSDAGFDAPPSMTEKARESFVMTAVASAVILKQDSLDRLLGSARAVVEGWEQQDLAAAVRNLSSAVDETTRCLAGELSGQKVLIICQGGLVQEVVGLTTGSYDICDCDVFEGPDEREGEEYFDGLSEVMKKYLRTTGWNKELPDSRRDSRSVL
jgi:hypothetical protein